MRKSLSNQHQLRRSSVHRHLSVLMRSSRKGSKEVGRQRRQQHESAFIKKRKQTIVCLGSIELHLISHLSYVYIYRYKKEEETGLTYGPVNEEYGKEKEEQNKKGTRERNVQKEQQSNSRITKFENNGESVVNTQVKERRVV
ncbi:hypothetical protein RUM43_002416 [Polyplax serrata]|uniref:Uncharacterized protein n=1 Tax=Polyplax serrata TaxID=468196 RepID=A0AAN8PFY5_POLSC